MSLLYLFIGILLWGRAVPSLPYIYLIIYIHVDSWTFILFSLLKSNIVPLLFILLFRLFQLWLLGALSDWFLCTFCTAYIQTPQMLQDHQLPQPLESNSSPKIPDLLYWRMIFRNQYHQELGVHLVYWGVTVSNPSQ